MGRDMNRPKPTSGLRHVALNVQDLDACEQFYVDLMGMQVEWRPDDDNLYLTSGNDNLALHRAQSEFDFEGGQRLDHLGCILDNELQVDEWYQYLMAHDVFIVKPPKTHRDGARSFYCRDPDGNVVQIIYHPPLAGR